MKSSKTYHTELTSNYFNSGQPKDINQNSKHTLMNLQANTYHYPNDILVGSQKFHSHQPFSSFIYGNYHTQNAYLQNHFDQTLSSLKRDRLTTQSYDWPKYLHNSTLFPQSGMSHKRYVAEIEAKLFRQQSKDPHLNRFATLYPYSFTEYQRMKLQSQQKSKVQEKWLETQIQRIKHQDQLLELKNKMKKKPQAQYLPLKIQQKKKVKEVFKQTRQQLKPNYTKLYLQNLSQTKSKSNKKNYLDHSFLDQILKNKSKNPSKTKNLSNSQVLSGDSKSKKSERREKQRKNAIKNMISRHFPKESAVTESNCLNQIKQQKFLTRDKYKYVSDTFGSELDDSYLLKSKNQNKYNDLYQKGNKKAKLKTELHQKVVTDQMIDRAFVFDQLNECESDFQEDVSDKNQSRKSPHYKSSLNVLYEKLYKTPERQKTANKQYSTDSQKYNNRADSKHQRPYNDLLVSIQRQKLLNKQSRPNKSFDFKNHKLAKTQKKSTPNLDSSSPQARDRNLQKPLQQFDQTSQMQIYNRSSDQRYPLFSPYSQHKNLPHQTHEYLTASLDRNKLTKHLRALDDIKRQTELKHPHHINVKDLIVDEIQKKKNLTKQQITQGFKQVQNKHYHMEIIRTVDQQRQEHKVPEPRTQYNTVIQQHQGQHQPNYLSLSSPSNFYHPRHQTHQNQQKIAKNLKIQFEILKQQLEDKNRKVVNLELQLMQIKNTLTQRKEEKEYESTTTTKLPNEDSRKDMTMTEDQECQTLDKQRHLSFSLRTLNEVVLPDEMIRTQQNRQAFRRKGQLKTLEEKLAIQEEVLNNLFEDIGMYQRLNQQLQIKVKRLQKEKTKS